jgi:hypothetical protein
METSSDVRDRAFKLLNSLQGGEILVTHSGLTCQFLHLSSRNVNLGYGKYLVLEEDLAGNWSVSETNDENVHL